MPCVVPTLLIYFPQTLETVPGLTGQPAVHLRTSDTALSQLPETVMCPRETNLFRQPEAGEDGKALEGFPTQARQLPLEFEKSHTHTHTHQE